MLTRVLPIFPPCRRGAALAGIATAAERGLRSRLDFLRFFSFRLSFGCGEFARLLRLSLFSLRPCLRVPPGVRDLEEDLRELCLPDERLEDREEEDLR